MTLDFIAAVQPWEVVLGIVAGLVGALAMWLEHRRPPLLDLELRERVARLEAKVDCVEDRVSAVERRSDS